MRKTAGEEGWEKSVPRKVEEAIKERGLFDYPFVNDIKQVALQY